MDSEKGHLMEQYSKTLESLVSVLANCSDPRSENLLFPECGPMAVNSPGGASGKLVSPGPYQFPAQQGLCPVVS